jgi:hypothetical protein
MAFTHNDVVKVDLHYYAAGIGFAANVFQAKMLQDTPHDYLISYVMADMKDWMERILSPIQPDVVVSCDITGASVYQKVGPLWNLLGNTSVVFVPTNSDDPLPSGVAALITWNTYVSKVQGKKYFPGMSESRTTAGLWIATILAHLASVAVEWIAGFDGLSDSTSHWYPGVWSSKMLSFQSFGTAGSIPDVPAYQRRRKAGVGI